MRRKKSSDMPLLGHLKELRKVLLYSLIAIGIGTIGGWALSDIVYRFLSQPMLGVDNISFITTTPMEPVLVKLTVSFVTGVIIALPIIFWKIWSFILPALKKNEKKYLYLIVPFSVLLFLCGAAFSYYAVLPTALKYLLFAGGEAVQSAAYVTKTSYLNFILTVLISFGVVFELPVILLSLIGFGILSPKTLAKFRKYAFFIIVVFSVVVCPSPDPLTQLLMSGPLYILYEVSVLIGLLIVRKREKRVSRLYQALFRRGGAAE